MSWMQTHSGRAFDLTDPRAEDVDFNDIAHALARIPRFLGHTQGTPYSIAQHCVEGASVFMAAGNSAAALAFLMHDAHEAYLGDITLPVQWAIERHLTELALGGVDPIRCLKREVDEAIFAAAGIADVVVSQRRAVKAMDLRMLRAERDALMVRPPKAWADAVEAAEPIARLSMIAPWKYDIAEMFWRNHVQHFLPGLFTRKGA